MPKTKTTALAKKDAVELPILPGIGGVDKTLLSEVIRELNSLYAAKSVETSCAIGEYILNRFFDGEFENFNKWGSKHKTFKELTELAQGDDSPLHISASGLWYSVKILNQVKALPEEIAMALPVTHHRMLVPVKDPKLKLKLAKEAISKGIPSRVFQEECQTVREEERKIQKKKVSSGRPAMPVWMKAINQTVKAVDGVNLNIVTKSSVDFYDEQSIKYLLSEADRAIDKIQKIKNKIKEQVG